MRLSWVCDEAVELAAPKLSKLTFLDVSSCYDMGARAIVALGKNCTSLVHLVRSFCSHDDEAHAIATWMPKLRHLEMKFARLIDDGVRELVSSCRDLEFLSVIGCEFMNLDQTVIMENFPRLTLECDSPAKSWDFRIGNKDDDDFWSACWFLARKNTHTVTLTLTLRRGEKTESRKTPLISHTVSRIQAQEIGIS